MPERRKFPRIDLDIDVFVRPLENEDATTAPLHYARSRNLSEKGFSFRCAQYFSPGINISITLKPKKLKETLSLEGKIIWCKKIDETSLFLTGVELVNVQNSNQTKFLERYLDKICSIFGNHLHL